MTIYTQGTFDLFHFGHLNLLKRCRGLSNVAGRVIVALLSDAAIEEYRGHPPIIPFEQRKAILEACTYVDEVIESDNKNTRDEIEKIRPDFVVLGTDWAKRDIYKQYGIEDKDWLNQLLVFFPYTNGVSSTDIKERIKNG